MEKRGKTFIISGPSGVGKSTVLGALFEGRDDLYFSVSATTRAPRPTETPDVDYHFIEAETFRQWIEDGEFLEYAEYVGNFYGTPKKFVDAAMAEGKDVILDIEIQGATQVHELRPDVVRIFIAPPSWEELERRLTARGTDSPERCRSACCGPRWSWRMPATTITLSSTIRWKTRCRSCGPSCWPSTAAPPTVSRS